MTSSGSAGSERQAFEALTQEHLPRLYAFALRLTGEHAAAEDPVQETYVKAYQAFHHVVPDRQVLQRAIRQSVEDIEVPDRLWDTIHTRMDSFDRAPHGHQSRAPRWAVLGESPILLAMPERQRQRTSSERRLINATPVGSESPLHLARAS